MDFHAISIIVLFYLYFVQRNMQKTILNMIRQIMRFHFKCNRIDYTTKTHFFQSRTSEKGKTNPSATTTGMQPACKASLNAVCPSLGPLAIRQNVAFCNKIKL